ncbi:putative spermidine/putrescine transport system permease protein [Mycetocola sp. CAN_C7]|uniref:ABC transporter permease n=1 Tax=Mycetocola sp. CAN_C7 TaxID=2787724 RepID=UPI0018CA166E
MSISTRGIVPSPNPPENLRLPGDPGRPLTLSRGVGRTARISGTLIAALWFTVPLLPLAFWSFADRWSFPSPVPTSWGLSGTMSALQQGGLSAFLHSLALGLAVAIIATPLGAVAARALSNGWAPFPRILTALLFAPVVLPPFAAAFGVNVLLLRAYVPPLVGLVLVLVVIAIPYTTFSMRVAYAAHDTRYEEEARTLGASKWQVLWTIQVPLLTPALARSAFLAFLVGWSDYLVTVIVGGGQVITLPLVTASAAAGTGNDAAVAILSLAAIIPPIVLLALLARSGRQHRGDRS